MRITRYDRGYTRRKFLNDAARGTLATGVLAPLWDSIAATGDISKAYPDELKSIEGYTKGKIKTGDMLTSANVEAVKDLLEPVRYDDDELGALEDLSLGRRSRSEGSVSDAEPAEPYGHG